MAVAPVRLLGPMLEVDPRSSHLLSSASHVGSTSRTSVLFFVHRSKFPSLHFQSIPSRRICAASVTELDEEELPAKRERWKKQTPAPREKFQYPQRGNDQKQEFPWRSAEQEPRNDRESSSYRQQGQYYSMSSNSNSSGYKQGYSQGPRSENFRQDRPSDAGPSRFNTDGPRNTQRRSYNSPRDGQAASANRRQGENGRPGGRNTTKSNGPPKRGTSRYSQYDTGRNMHRAPWEQGPARTARGNFRDTRRQPPLAEEEYERNESYNKDSRFRRENSRSRGETPAMSRIVEKLRSIQKIDSATRQELDFKRNRAATETSNFLPRPDQPVLPGSDRRWSNPDHPVPKWATDASYNSWDEDEDEAEYDEEEEEIEKKKVKPPSTAELTLLEDELKRLRGLGLMVRQRLKIGRMGVTPGIVEAIHNGWRISEIVKVKCDGPPALNMRKTHDELEKLTGGLVIWRSGTAAVVYRGKDYVSPSIRQMQEREEAERNQLAPLGMDEEDEREEVKEGEEVDSKDDDSLRVSGAEEGSTTEVEKEDPELELMEEILEGLGPRYADWTRNRPVPVDGDLLLSEDAPFKRPFRLIPHGVKPTLNDFEMTELRRIARPIPPHFVLGKNRGLNGLASAIMKLWEKSEIVKIGVKKGVQNTNNERMAEELKRLTGGVLLSRDKEYIVLYRGKDFLPAAVQAALEERDRMSRALQEEEETVRVASRSNAVQLADGEPSTVGTLAEALETKTVWASWQGSEEQQKVRSLARKAARAQAASKIERKVNLAAQKKERAERELAKLDAQMRPADEPVDQEHISEEERHMFRKLGLRMRAFLLLGRRGVFDGVVENMHLHWKHRELVKILVKAPMSEVEQTAKMLEIESGGVLVAIVNTSKGQAIIVYRGKNYQRPPELRPRHLLTKRQALKRSLEMQRKQSLEKHILNLEKEIQTMQVGLNKMEKHDDDLDREGAFAEASAELMEDLEEFDDVEFELDADYNEDLANDKLSLYKEEKPKNRGVTLDPIFRAEPLTRKERLLLRQQALKLNKAAHLNVGKSNVVAGLAKSIRLYFQKHPLVKVGVKGRAKGTPVAEIVQQIEEATGAVLVSTEPSKLIFYRGWPAGEQRPDMATDQDDEEVPPELRAAILKEEAVRDPTDFSYLTEEECAMVGIEYKGHGEETEEEVEGEESGEEDDMGINAWDEKEWDTEDDDDDDDDEEGEGEDNEEWEEDDDEDEVLDLIDAQFDELDSEQDESETLTFENSLKAASIQTASLKSTTKW